MERDEVTNYIASLFETRGNSMYGGEAVTQLEHALQAAMLAENEGCDVAAISAALLHDVGHLAHDLPENAPEDGIDDRHEALAYRFLKQYFPPEVSEPVKLHVAAKRYLCTIEPTYYDSLSGPSKQSLELQGGPFLAHQAAEFEQHKYFRAAVSLRRWDDLAKVPGLETPSLDHFLNYVTQLFQTPSATETRV